MDWLAALDQWLGRCPGFLAERSIVLDLSKVSLSRAGVIHLVASLAERNVRVVGLDGADPALVGPELPPLLRGGRTGEPVTSAPPSPAAAKKPEPKRPASLVLNEPVRSGQTIFFPEGDVSVLGSVGSGAEIVAGGSVHIYGTLRGRVMAGSTGDEHARIFCQKIEAELLAINGYYRTAEEIDQTVRSRPSQAWLDGNTIMISALN
ncbi:MAG TPA: septum site-determining protein MinC [Pseudolabrys sp.]|nr:septum site-determining protein MinC [Pseudolabrys sp.]